MEEWKKKKVSKLLSYILRHNPDEIRIEMNKLGWVNINDLITKSAHKIKFDREELNDVVASCDKQRFTISKDGKSIRAAQGHSINVELDLRSVTPPDKLYHGTSQGSVEIIMRMGL